MLWQLMIKLRMPVANFDHCALSQKNLLENPLCAAPAAQLKGSQGQRWRTGRSLLGPRFILLFSLLLGLWVASAQAAPRKILVLGDSLSAAYGIPVEAGWVSLIAQRLDSAQVQIINASVSGETTAGGQARLAALLKKEKPQGLILALGANDGLRGLPLQQTEAQLKRMIQLAKTQKVSVLLIGMRIPPNYGKRYSEDFFNLFARLARTQKVAYLPFLLAPIASDPDQFQRDGLHPTEAAQAKIADTVWQTVAPWLRTIER